MQKRLQRAAVIFTIFSVAVFFVAAGAHAHHHSDRKHQKSIAAISDTVSVDAAPAITICAYSVPIPHLTTTPVHLPDVISTVLRGELQSPTTRPPPLSQSRWA